MSNFFTVTNENKAKLEDVVNSISPAGATRSDYAMELALKQIEQSKNDESRKYAKRISFCNGWSADDLSNFDDDVANKAITTSKKIKKRCRSLYIWNVFFN